jgi:nuclear pore complex protein Nup62
MWLEVIMWNVSFYNNHQLSCVRLHILCTYVVIYVPVLLFMYICCYVCAYVAIYVPMLVFMYLCCYLCACVDIYVHMLLFMYPCCHLCTYVAIYVPMLPFMYQCCHLCTYVAIYVPMLLCINTTAISYLNVRCRCLTAKAMALPQHPASIFWILKIWNACSRPSDTAVT